MRILVDRHHADLLYSLQRLFEDRLGMELYVPVGREWWDAEYWRFGQGYGDDRLVRQFLELNDGWDWLDDGVYVTTDPSSHPGRMIRGVTLEHFKDVTWDFVMPSVPDNLPGYGRLAAEVDARLLYHVGNTGQWVDWNLNPLVISTSEMPLDGGRGVVVHQELDSGPGQAFGFWSPAAQVTRVVRSTLNAFDRLPGYGDFLSAEEALIPEGWTFTSHGHDGRDGNLNPVTWLGANMAAAGWGWHDKPVGDGFGHVVHAWAAVGRPLIGHAGYYAGKMAGPLWRDGVTCLDLGARSLEETVQLMREVAANPDRHREMCATIRATFDQLVNYEAEAATVAALLEVPLP